MNDSELRAIALQKAVETHGGAHDEKSVLRAALEYLEFLRGRSPSELEAKQR